MLGPDYKAGCPSCSAIADGFNGFVVHLANHDVTLTAVSRAPLAKRAGVQAADGLDASRGRRRSVATSTTTSAWASPRSSSGRVSGNTTSRRRTSKAVAESGGGRDRRRDRRRRRHRLADVLSRAAGHERVRARGRRRLPHATRPTRAGWTACGACTSGSTAHPWDATRRDSGGAAMTSTTSAERAFSGVFALLLRGERRRERSSGARRCRPWPRCRCPAGGRCRWRGCGCPGRRGPAPRRRSSACGS